MDKWIAFSKSQLKILAQRLMTEPFRGCFWSLHIYVRRVSLITPWQVLGTLFQMHSTTWHYTEQDMAYLLMSGFFLRSFPVRNVLWTWVKFSWVTDVSPTRCKTKVWISRKVNFLIAKFTINIQIDQPSLNVPPGTCSTQLSSVH